MVACRFICGCVKMCCGLINLCFAGFKVECVTRTRSDLYSQSDAERDQKKVWLEQQKH